MSNILTFDDLTTNNKALKKFVQAFTRAGAPVATIDTDGKPKRTTGVTYRELVLTFVDNQKAVFLIKQGGSIFQVKINGAVVPIKNQDDQVKAVGEIVQILDAGRAKFQAKLARQKVALPSGLKTAAPRLEVKLQEASTKLAQDIATAQARVAELKSELGEAVLDSSDLKATIDLPINPDAPRVDAPQIQIGTDDNIYASRAAINLASDRGAAMFLTGANDIDDEGLAIDERVRANIELNLDSALTQAKAIIAGEVLDDSHAVANLKISLDIVEQNYPIHVAEGKLDQAELEKSAAESFKEAIAILEQKEAA